MEQNKAEDFRIGDWVAYKRHPGTKLEQGRVKIQPAPGDDHVFVVYHCGEEWDNYMNYTAARTPINKLIRY